mmetsp:Transcript_10702/g.30186  ORF Transcript_10702/g.30186 Transcript_10702/m.30186 type:complete len:426 (+) Transcript_10702:63-1340(+)
MPSIRVAYSRQRRARNAAQGSDSFILGGQVLLPSGINDAVEEVPRLQRQIPRGHVPATWSQSSALERHLVELCKGCQLSLPGVGVAGPVDGVQSSFEGFPTSRGRLLKLRDLGRHVVPPLPEVDRLPAVLVSSVVHEALLQQVHLLPPCLHLLLRSPLLCGQGLARRLGPWLDRPGSGLGLGLCLGSRGVLHLLGQRLPGFAAALAHTLPALSARPRVRLSGRKPCRDFLLLLQELGFEDLQAPPDIGRRCLVLARNSLLQLCLHGRVPLCSPPRQAVLAHGRAALGHGQLEVQARGLPGVEVRVRGVFQGQGRAGRRQRLGAFCRARRGGAAGAVLDREHLAAQLHGPLEVVRQARLLQLLPQPPELLAGAGHREGAGGCGRRRLPAPGQLLRLGLLGFQFSNLYVQVLQPPSKCIRLFVALCL